MKKFALLIASFVFLSATSISLADGPRIAQPGDRKNNSDSRANRVHYEDNVSAQIDPNSDIHDPTTVQTSNVSESFSLKTYPNPARNSSQLEFSVLFPTELKIKLYDLSGNLVRLIADRSFQAGKHIFPINIEALQSGTYFILLQSGQYSESNKLVVEK